jgi:hypothetical protein
MCVVVKHASPSDGLQLATSTPEVSVKTIAAEWLRAIRGKRPQSIVSRQLGYKSNAIYRWEAGTCFPSASAALRLVEHCGGDAARSLRAFLPGASSWSEGVEMATPQGIQLFIGELRGKLSITELSAATQISRFALSRWFNGHSEPSLPELLLLVEKASLRLLDFLASFTDPQQIPAVRSSWERLVSSRRAAYDYPWSHGVLRALELEEYARLPEHTPGWLAQRLGTTEAVERESVDVLERAGQIAWKGAHYSALEASLVDTRTDPQRARALKVWWTQLALERMKAGTPGVFAYNLCSLSKEGLHKVEKLQRAYFRQMSQIIADSKGAEHVVLYAAQLLRLDE